jgi:predicted ATP-grasp superfamily ATP-dependent carboligase
MEWQSSASGQPRVLLVSTVPWMFPARLASAFAQLDFCVDAVCQWGHPIRSLSKPVKAHRLGWVAEAASIETALRRAKPDFIVPCDDPAVRALHQLHQRCSDLQDLIERSLGDPLGFATTEQRSALVELARSMGLLVPQSYPVDGRVALSQLVTRIGYPLVLKRDMTWGGLGTQIVESQGELRKAWSSAKGYAAVLRAGKAVVRDWRPRTVIDWLVETPAIEAQEFLPGTPANRAVLCRTGRVVAGLSVEAVRTAYAGGPASVVRVIEHKEMADAVEALVAQLGLSGFCGFDFLLSPSGRACLLELNPRATPVCHLAVADGTHLPSALYRDLTGREPSSTARTISNSLIALFPAQRHSDGTSSVPSEAHYDLPLDEPALLAMVGAAAPKPPMR